MIVVEEGQVLTLVTQPDHARFAAELLALWRDPEMRGHPRRSRLLAAVREHDNGWREADAAPRIDPAAGRPFDFRSLPAAVRREIWRRGSGRYAASRPYLALLATQHALALHRGRRQEPEWQRFCAELEQRRQELLDASALDETRLAADYRWLELADALSLAVCCRSARPVVRGRLRARWRDGALEIDPFPLAGVTTFRIPCRRIPARRYGGEADLATELGAARWAQSEVRCRGGGA